MTVTSVLLLEMFDRKHLHNDSTNLTCLIQHAQISFKFSVFQQA